MKKPHTTTEVNRAGTGCVRMPMGITHRNASNEPCDMLIGPCCCGATHSLDLWSEEFLIKVHIKATGLTGAVVRANLWSRALRSKWKSQNASALACEPPAPEDTTDEIEASPAATCCASLDHQKPVK